MGMSDDDNPHAMFKPQNVSEEAAEGYLLANGWVKDVLFTPENDPKKWIPPNSGGRKLTRGQAVMRQFKADFASLMFVMNHAHPDALLMLIPPSVIAKVQEQILANMPKPEGPSN